MGLQAPPLPSKTTRVVAPPQLQPADARGMAPPQLPAEPEPILQPTAAIIMGEQRYKNQPADAFSVPMATEGSTTSHETKPVASAPF